MINCPMDHPGRFMASRDDYSASRFVLFGVPMDFTTSYRPGARFGPGRVREASFGVEEFSFHQLRDLNDVAFCDIGDVPVIFGQVTESLALVQGTAAEIVAAGKVPVMIGGEHLCTVPVVQAALTKYPDLAVLQFDAHADLREEYLGNPLSHACAMRRCLEAGVSAAHLYQLGIRSGTRDEYDFARRHAHLFPMDVLAPLQQLAPTLGRRPVYVTIDIDVLDPAFAPGTGTPEPGGVSSREMLAAIRLLGDLNVIGMDLVEVAPTLDPTDRTSVLAALLIREALLTCSISGS